MEPFIETLRNDYPRIKFKIGDGFYWSPKSSTIIYREKASRNLKWTLLHEIAHAELRHKTYSKDIELLGMEVAAWDKAQKIAKKYDISIKTSHIQNCLDSYRNWLHQRSTCPNCSNRSLQTDSHSYKCFNCHTEWKVSTARFCRPYRKIKQQKETPPETMPQVMFL